MRWSIRVVACAGVWGRSSCFCWPSGAVPCNWKSAKEPRSAKKPCVPTVAKNSCPRRGGRILARDGTVLACDREVAAVAVQYRYLEEPPRLAWLEQQARKRLPGDQRRNAARVAEEVEKLRQERDDLHRRLSALCGIDFSQWQARARKVQVRVERIAADVRRRPIGNGPLGAAARRCVVRPSDSPRPCAKSSGPPATPCRKPSPWPKNWPTMSWQRRFHAAAAAEIRQHAEHYPGTRIISLTRRSYPAGTFAAHVLGYLGPPRYSSRSA